MRIFSMFMAFFLMPLVLVSCTPPRVESGPEEKAPSNPPLFIWNGVDSELTLKDLVAAALFSNSGGLMDESGVRWAYKKADLFLRVREAILKEESK